MPVLQVGQQRPRAAGVAGSSNSGPQSVGLPRPVSLSLPLFLCNLHVLTRGSGVSLVLGLGIREVSQQGEWPRLGALGNPIFPCPRLVHRPVLPLN